MDNMKIVKLFSRVMLLCMAVAVTSCSGEDGERGPEGPVGAQGPVGATGADGADGMDGQDGTNGIDGNANVQSFTINMEAWNGGLFFEFDMPVAAEDRDNYAFLFYLEYIYDSQFVGRHSVPGSSYDGDFVVDVSYAMTGEEEGILLFKDFQGVPYAVAPGTYLNLIIISIEISNLEGKNGTTDILSELKAKGVDTNDYDAVAAYFGLD